MPKLKEIRDLMRDLKERSGKTWKEIGAELGIPYGTLRHSIGKVPRRSIERVLSLYVAEHWDELFSQQHLRFAPPLFELDKLVDVLRGFIPTDEEWLFDPGLSYDVLSDQAIHKLNLDFHGYPDAGLAKDLTEAAQEHRDKVSNARSFASRRLFVPRNNWRDFLCSRGAFHEGISEGARLQTVKNILRLMQKRNHTHAPALRLFLVDDRVLPAAMQRNGAGKVEAALLNYTRNFTAEIRGPQCCWFSRERVDLESQDRRFAFLLSHSEELTPRKVDDDVRRATTASL